MEDLNYVNLGQLLAIRAKKLAELLHKRKECANLEQQHIRISSLMEIYKKMCQDL